MLLSVISRHSGEGGSLSWLSSQASCTLRVLPSCAPGGHCCPWTCAPRAEVTSPVFLFPHMQLFCATFPETSFDLINCSLLSFFFFPQTAKLVGSQFPDKGSNPGPWQRKHGVLSTGPPGNSPLAFFWQKIILFNFISTLLSVEMLDVMINRWK